MEIHEMTDAWLEKADGTRVPLRGNCAFGRSSDNTVCIRETRVSRRHAVIHAQEGGEFWLIDLGSSNGTLRNGRRVAQPSKLHDGDRIAVGDALFTFRQREAGQAGDIEASSCGATILDIRNERCWLLIADLVNFTPLSQRLAPDQLAELVGGWVRRCKEVIEQNGGTINKYLGDGFLAYWRAGAETAVRVAAVLTALREVQVAGSVEFRVVVHCGSVAIGGNANSGEEGLMGPEVNLTFRVEKLAGALGIPICLTESAARLLEGAMAATPIPGEHELKGFPGRHRVFAAFAG